MLQNSLADVLGYIPPQPQFELWQAVRSPYTNEFGESFVDEGLVIGFFYSLDLHTSGHECGWWYVIYWTATPSSPGVTMPCVHEATEAELRAF